MLRQKKLPGRAKPHQQHKPGQMNKTELAYSVYLDTLKSAGTIHCWWFEAMKLRVSYDSCFITFDFMVQLPDGTLELHDVKGGPTKEDATIKMKVIADLFPFRIVEARKAKRGGGWDLTEITPVEQGEP